MKVLVIGAQGMLGSDLVTALNDKFETAGKDIDDFDITDKAGSRDAIIDIDPAVVINTAAFTDVDGCESDEKQAFLVNAQGVKNIAEICREMRIKLIHISTDYIFDGKKGEPYLEGDQPGPLSVYGRSKLMGEEYVKTILSDFLIIRTQWLYGKRGKNFVKTVLKLAKKQKELTMVNDQVGSPTFTMDLSGAIIALLESFSEGIFHVSNEGYCTWYQFAGEILKLTGFDNVNLVPISSEKFARPAVRPHFSKFNCKKFKEVTGKTMRPWSEALANYLKYEIDC